MANLKKLFSRLLRKKVLVTLIILIFVIGSGVVLFFFSKGLNIIGNSNDPQVEAERIIKEVGNIYLLPEEVPTLATVSDKNQLADQVFFQKAENGDKVLIYRTAAIAILYRPSIGKIINVGPVTLDEGEIEAVTNPQGEQPADKEPEELDEVDVLILNGTNIVGLTQGASDDISELEFANVIDRLDAENKPYEKTVIVVLNSRANSQAESISDIIAGDIVKEMPAGESGTSADIVLILGEDYASEE